MKQKLYSIKDIKSHHFGVPFVAFNDDIAKRTTANTLIGISPTHLMFAFASDYELYFLGEVLDDGTLVTAENGPKAIIFLSDLIQAFKIEQKKGVILDDLRKQNELSDGKASE